MGKRKEDSDLHRIKLDAGTVYQTTKNGTYYYRYQVQKERKCISLGTSNQEEAIRKAKVLLPTVQASNLEIIATHIKVARKLATQIRSLPLSQVWETYANHPDRALPATVHEQLSYKATFAEFLRFIDGQVSQFSQITTDHSMKFAEYLRTTQISVSTHNRKIVRLRKIFSTLQSYREDGNPFALKILFRKAREEQDTAVRRMAFTREQEEQIRTVLDDPKYRLINKNEIKVIFYLGMYTGQRLKDCVLIHWQNVDLEHQRIQVKQFKTGKEVTIPMAPKLYEVLLEARKWKVNAYVNPNVALRYKQTDKRGKSVGDNHVDIDVMRVIRWIGVETSVPVEGRKKKATVFGFHSLRHSFASFCAEAGVPKAVVVSILGANSEIIDEFYTHVGEDAQRAAVEAIAGTSASTPSGKIKRALEYIDSIKTPSEELLTVKKILVF